MRSPTLVSVNGASELLERDRRTIRRALRSVPPDGDENGQPRWRLASVVDALQIHDRRMRPQAFPRAYDPNGIIAELEDLSRELEYGFERMKQETDLERRRKLGLKFGPIIGRSIEAVNRSLELEPEGSRTFMKWATSRMLGDIINHWLWLMQYELILDDE
jgi:hypothetical protein